MTRTLEVLREWWTGERLIQLSLDRAVPIRQSFSVLSLDPEAPACQGMMNPRKVDAIVQYAHWRVAHRLAQIDELERIHALKDRRVRR